MNKLALSSPQRQSILGVAVIFFSNLRKAFNFFLAVVFVNLGTKFKILGLDLEDWAYILSAIFLIISYLQYLKFSFYIKGDNFVIEKGVLSQEKVNVPFARIQTVNTSQNIVQRILGVVGLKIDTAGSIQNEIQIPALTKGHALELREYLMQRKFESSNESDQETDLAKAKNISAEKKETSAFLTLRLKELLLVGLTQNHFRSGLFLFAVVNGYVWQFEDYLLKPFESYLEETAESFLTQWILLLPIAILIFLVISVLASMIGTALTHYQFKFYLDEDGMRMSGGLLAKQTFNVPYEKIQYFKWESNPLRALIGFYTLRVKQAGTAAINDRKLISIPGLKARALLKVLKAHYPKRKDKPFKVYAVNSLLFVQLFIWLGLIPALLLSVLNFWLIEEFWLYPVLVIHLLMVAFLSGKYFQHYQIKVSGDFVQIRRGWIFPSVVFIPNYKLQNLSLKQTIFQKRRNVASLSLYTAAGGETLLHLRKEEAQELYNYLLFCIESSREKWM